MAKNAQNSSYTVCEDMGIGAVNIADEVVTVIAALAATEVEGVSALVGNVTNSVISKVGAKGVAKGIKVEIDNDVVRVYVSIILEYGYSIPDVSKKVQEKIETAIETMTGVKVEKVNVKIAGVKIEK